MNPIRGKKKAKDTAVAAPAVKRTFNHVGKSLALKPRISEKTYALSEQHNTYAFMVPAGISKQHIAHAVTNQYEVTVTAVRIAGTPGKTQRTYQRGGRIVHKGQRSDIRKAYVTLKEGDKLPIFAAVEESEAPKETK